MSVHVDELHSEVVPAGSAAAGGAREPQNPWAAEERRQEMCGRAAWLAARVRAEDFDD
ncbi:hypothetical protein ACWD3I_20175 [Streptomyces sp. NPDC002817]|uniref:hypothetical protein n=1 Tax=Streptomyces sp. NPDC088357 TaxID=3154655 RepID=UPI00343974FD